MSGAPSLVPSLKDLCVGRVAAQFQANPTFGDLPDKIAKKVTDALPIDLPFELAVALVADEQYQPATGDLLELRRLMNFSSRFAHGLRLQQLPSHLDLQILFQAMGSELASLSLAYNQGSVGMDYDRAFNNNLDDDKLRMLSSGLADNISVTHLNLSHNNISDRGVRTLAKLLDADSVISWLDLSDNQVHADELDMSCNSIGEQMGPELLSALLTSTSLLAVDVRGCGLSADITGKVADELLSRMEKRNRELTKITAVAQAAGTW
eukprot:gene13344-13472_t